MILDLTKTNKKTYNNPSEGLWFDLVQNFEEHYKSPKSSIIDSDQELNKLLLKLYQFSEKDNFYWIYCPTEVYINTYKEREQKYLEDNSNSPKITFAKKELDFIKLLTESAKKYLFYYEVLKIENGKQTLTKKMFEFHVYSKELHQYIEIDKFRKKVFLNNKLKENNTPQKEIIDRIEGDEKVISQASNLFNDQKDFMQIFLKNGYKLFLYLDENYTIDNSSPKAKYSFLYHFLHSNGYIMNRKQGKYIEGIKKHHSETLSRIQPVQDNYKYQTDVRAKLAEYELKFLGKR